jgi:hypothetical protein
LGVVQNPRPALLDPAVDGALVAFGGAADRALDGPAKPVAQQGPQVGGMVPHPGPPLDHGGDPVQRPQLTDEPVGGGALEQDLFDLAELAVRQAWCGSGRPSAAQGVAAASLPMGMPVAGALAGDIELAGDLGLADAEGEQLGGAQPAGLEVFAFLLRRSTAGSGWHALILLWPSRQLQPDRQLLSGQPPRPLIGSLLRLV